MSTPNSLGIKITLYSGDDIIRQEGVSSFDDAEELLGSMQRNWEADEARAESQVESFLENQHDARLEKELQEKDLEKEMAMRK